MHKDTIYITPYPPKEIFNQKSIDPVERVFQEKKHTTIIERIEYPESGGIFIYHKNMPYPVKGFPTAEAVRAVNIVKRYFLSLFKLLSIPEIMTGIGILFLSSKKRKGKILDKIIGVSNAMLGDVIDVYITQERYWSAPTKEIKKLIKNILLHLGVTESNAENFSLITSQIVEYDNAYCLRLQDVYSETSKERIIENPRKEFKRLFFILKHRELSSGVINVASKIEKLVDIALLSPWIRKSIVEAFRGVTDQNIWYTEADKYHALTRADYLPFGKSLDDRLAKFYDIHYDQGSMPEWLSVQH